MINKLMDFIRRRDEAAVRKYWHNRLKSSALTFIDSRDGQKLFLYVGEDGGYKLTPAAHQEVKQER